MKETTLIEKTAKRWKAAKILGFSIAAIGVLTLASGIDYYFSPFLIVVGSALLVIASIEAFWRHG